MKYSNNPYSVHSTMISSQRNMFLTSSIAISLIGFSDTFKDKHIIYYIKILGLVIFTISIYIGITASNEFTYYLDNNKNLPDDIPIKSWRRWKYVNYVYTCLLSLIIFILINKKILI